MSKSLDQLLEQAKHLIDKIESGEEELENKKVLKTVKVKKEWQAALKKVTQSSEEGQELTMKLRTAMDKHKTLTRAFWARVEEDLNLFSNTMRLSEDNTEIVIYEDDFGK